MTTPVNTRLRAICQFLEGDILPEVPAEKRSDMRSALKMLENMESELAALPGLLVSESKDMARLCAASIAALGGDPVAKAELSALDHSASLIGEQGRWFDDALEVHARLCTLMGRLAARLVAWDVAAPNHSPNELLSDGLFEECCAFLGRQARARMNWQAVFPVEGLFLDARDESRSFGES